MKRVAVIAFVLLLVQTDAIACQDNSKGPLPSPRPVSAATKAQHEQAAKLEAAGRVKDSVVLYRKAADGGYGPSARALSSIYDRGKGDVARDYKESLNWAHTAWNLGEDVGWLKCR